MAKHKQIEALLAKQKRLSEELKRVEANLVQVVSPPSGETLEDESPDNLTATHAEQLQKSRSAFQKLVQPPKDPVKRRKWFINRILVLANIVALAILAILLGADKPVVASIFVVVGIVTQIFTGALALIGLIPVVGPLIVGVLSLPFIWLMNGLGYVFSVKLAAEGKGRELLNWRTVTIVFVIGLAFGIVIGRLLPAGK